MKQIKSLRTLSSKKGPKYEIRKEHVEFDDGTTADRVFCYEFNGKPLGGIKEADQILARRELAKAVVTAPKFQKGTRRHETR